MRLRLQVRSDGKRFGGESWLWARDGFRVVVDIGNAPEFRHRAASFSPNVVVLTHDDDDHIGRSAHAAKFIRDLPRVPDKDLPWEFLSVGWAAPVEFWMPMDWLHLARAALQVLSPAPGREPDSSSNKDLGEPTANDESNNKYILRYFDPAAKELTRTRRQAPSDHTEWGYSPDPGEENDRSHPELLPSEMRMLAGLPTEGLRAAVQSVIDDYRAGTLASSLPTDAEAISTRAVRSVERVGSILAELAVRRIPVRFFDVDRAWLRQTALWPGQGLRGVATIINAVETHLPPPVRFHFPARALLFASRLTIQNQRALATFLWPTPGEPLLQGRRPHGGDGVLIWSDTMGKVGGKLPTGDLVPWRHIGLMSAAHHASREMLHRPLWQHRPHDVSVILSNNRESDANEWLALHAKDRDCADCGRRRQSPVGATSRGTEGGVTLLGHCIDAAQRRTS